jgi:hypothetical protein
VSIVVWLLLYIGSETSQWLSAANMFLEHVYNTRYPANGPSASDQSCASTAWILPSCSYPAPIAHTVLDCSDRLRGPTGQDSTAEGCHGRWCVASHSCPAGRKATKKDGYAMDIEQRGKAERKQIGGSGCTGDYRCCGGQKRCMGKKSHGS